MRGGDRYDGSESDSRVQMQPAANKLTRFLPAACIALYAFIALFYWVDDVWHPEWDGAIYLLTGESMARGDGYLYQGQPFFLRPPGMSWILSMSVREDGYDPYRINLMLMSFGVTAVAAIYWAVRISHGVWIGLSVALLAGTSPMFTDAFNEVLSEFPFLTLFFAGVALLSTRRSAGEPRTTTDAPAALGWPAMLGGALCLAGALYLRTVAILVLPGVLLIGWRSRPQRLRALVALALVAALGAPWILFSHSAAKAAPVPAEQLYLHDYGTALFRVDPGDPASALVDTQGWIDRIRKNGGLAAADLADLLHLGTGAAARTVLVLLTLAGYLIALRRGATLFEWLAPVYAALVLTYFTYAVRLTAPLAPLVYLYALLAVRSLARLAARRIARPRLAHGATALAATLLLGMNGMQLGRPQELEPAKQDLFTIAAWLRENTATDAGILCNQAPVLEQLSGRRCYTFRFLRKLKLLERYDLDYIVFDQRNKQLFQALSSGPTKPRFIHTDSGARIPVFPIPGS
ncbi:MAG: hypothetical protein ACI8QZ_002033 [Chlamydiales bacterium]|jgi:hypothetical protein